MMKQTRMGISEVVALAGEVIALLMPDIEIAMDRIRFSYEAVEPEAALARLESEAFRSLQRDFFMSEVEAGAVLGGWIGLDSQARREALYHLNATLVALRVNDLQDLFS